MKGPYIYNIIVKQEDAADDTRTYEILNAPQYTNLTPHKAKLKVTI